MVEVTDQFIGKTLGSYRLIKKLGEGGMGAVYLAQHLALGKKVAVKILPTSFSQDTERVKRFTREARAAAQLEHPNIIQVFDIRLAKPEGFYFIVMQYLEGESLDMYIKRRGKLSLAEATHIMKESASALAIAHSQGIIHRDIKPENIMINPVRSARADTSNGVNHHTTPHLEVKLMDFGLARIGNTTSSISSAGDILGTPHYMAPEQARGEPTDARSDIYALGITYYYALTGQKPFDGTTPVTVIMKHLNEPPPDPRRLTPDIPAKVSAVIIKMMAKNPKARYQSAQELITDLDKVLVDTQNIPTAKTVISKEGIPLVSSSTGQKLFRRKLIIIGGAMALLAIFLGLSMAIISHKRTKKLPPPGKPKPTTPSSVITPTDVAPPNPPDPAQSEKEELTAKLKEQIEGYCKAFQGGYAFEVRKYVEPSKVRIKDEDDPLWQKLAQFFKSKEKGVKIQGFKIAEPEIIKRPNNIYGKVRVIWTISLLGKDKQETLEEDQLWIHFKNKRWLRETDNLENNFNSYRKFMHPPAEKSRPDK